MALLTFLIWGFSYASILGLENLSVLTCLYWGLDEP